MIRTGNENLFYFRFNRERCGTNALRIYRNPPVTQHFESQFFGGAVEDIPAFFPEHNVPGEKQHAYSIPAVSGKLYTQANALIKKEFVRSLDHDTRPITCVAFTAA